MADVAADVRSLDPAAYAAAIGLLPEDSYGFLPLDHDDITPYLYLYRDRPEYERARAGLPAPQREQSVGPVRVEPAQHVELVLGDVPAAAPGAGRIVAHRVYPRIGRRASTRQLNHFLPQYLGALGLCSHDVYGVLPLRTRWSASTKEWDDFWIVYRDRPEYEPGRQAWAHEMHKDGGWPEPVVSAGVGGPAGSGSRVASMNIEKDGWPRRKLVMRETGPELADSLRKKIARWGYRPEDSLGFCPDFANRSICFA